MHSKQNVKKKPKITIIPICCQYGSIVIKLTVLKLIFMFYASCLKNVLQRVSFNCLYMLHMHVKVLKVKLTTLHSECCFLSDHPSV